MLYKEMPQGTHKEHVSDTEKNLPPMMQSLITHPYNLTMEALPIMTLIKAILVQIIHKALIPPAK